MIVRTWRGWADGADGDAYERLLLGEVAPRIMARQVPGLREMSVLRRVGDEVPGGSGEFLTAMTFDDLEAVARFTGGDPSASVVPPAARRLLSRFDAHSQHFDHVRRFRAG